MFKTIIRDQEHNEVSVDYMHNYLGNTRWFKITYYHKGQGKEVTRYGNWDSKCRVWLTKNDDIAVCYLQVDENNEPQGYRTATNVIVIAGKPKEKLSWDNISRLDS